jgi:hypothetical protein
MFSCPYLVSPKLSLVRSPTAQCDISYTYIYSYTKTHHVSYPHFTLTLTLTRAKSKVNPKGIGGKGDSERDIDEGVRVNIKGYDSM